MASGGELEEVAQLLVTVPEDTAPGTVLSIPLNGGRTVRARVPPGYGPGSTLVLSKREGTDEWEVEQGEQVANASFNEEEPTSRLMDPLDPLNQPLEPICHTVRLETTVGIIDIIVRLDWAPYGARRFLELAACGDLDDLAFYRSIKGCLAQFGLPTKRQWPPIPDDPPCDVPFLLGAVCFAANSPNSRKSTLFICTGDMSQWFGEEPWETPIGAVAEMSLDVLDRIETVYGETAECGGTGPQVSRLIEERNVYLQRDFPALSYISRAAALDWPPKQQPQSPALPAEAQHEQIQQSTEAQCKQCQVQVPCALEVVGLPAPKGPAEALHPPSPWSPAVGQQSPAPVGSPAEQVTVDTELAKMEAQKAAVEAALQRARSLGTATSAPGGAGATQTPTVIQHRPMVPQSAAAVTQAHAHDQQNLNAPLLPPLQLQQMQLPQLQPLQFSQQANQLPPQLSPADAAQHMAYQQQGQAHSLSPTQPLFPPPQVQQQQQQQAASPPQPLAQQQQQCPQEQQQQQQQQQQQPQHGPIDELSTTHPQLNGNSGGSRSSAVKSLSYVPPPIASQSGQSYSYVPEPQAGAAGGASAFGLKPPQWLAQPNGVAFGLQPVGGAGGGGGPGGGFAPSPAWSGGMPPPPSMAGPAMPSMPMLGAPPFAGPGMPMGATPPPLNPPPLGPPAGSWAAPPFAAPPPGTGPPFGAPFPCFGSPPLQQPHPGAPPVPRMPYLGGLPFPSLALP